MNSQTLPDHPDQNPVAHRSSILSNLLITLPFLLLYWVDLAHHQLWFDEINAWAIAAAAHSFKDLLRLVHFEAHPWLWYVLLYGPSRFTHDPVAMKWVAGLFGTGVYLLIGLYSPFTRLQKALIFLSYYIIFEYTVMSRMYVVMLFLAFLYVARRVRRPDQLIPNAILLGLLASTDMTGVLLSGALLLEYAYSTWIVHRVSGWKGRAKRDSVTAVAVYLTLVALSILSLVPAKEISWQSSGPLGAEMWHARRIVQSTANLLATPWWPISRHFPHSFWSADAMETRWLLALTPLVAIAYWQIFKTRRNLLLLMGLTFTFEFLFTDIIYWGRVRHWGVVIVAFFVALWMQAADRIHKREADPSRWSPWAYGLLSMGAASGLLAFYSTWSHPFSQAATTAHWIEQHNPPSVPLVGDWDLALSAVTEEMQVPAYYLECGCTDTFKLFSHDRDQFKHPELPWRLARAMNDLKAPKLLLVAWEPLTPEDLARLHAASFTITPSATFLGSEEQHMSYYLYYIGRS